MSDTKWKQVSNVHSDSSQTQAKQHLARSTARRVTAFPYFPCVLAKQQLPVSIMEPVTT
jgi:hypothetical protein